MPVLIIEDTDHWAATPEVASQFFDQVVKALSKGPALDAVTIVAVQPVHRDSEGYQVVRELLTWNSRCRNSEPHGGLAVLQLPHRPRERRSYRQ